MTMSVFYACQSRSSASQPQRDQTIPDSLNAFIEQIDGFEYTQLGIRCRDNDLKEVQNLVAMGADISQAKRDEIYEYDGLSVAIENGHARIVDYLIKNNADVNGAYNEDGLTPLGLAVKRNENDIAQLLIANGADVNGIASSGTDYIERPLLIAVKNNMFGMAEILIRSGADIDDTDAKGVTIKNLILSKGDKWNRLLSRNDAMEDTDSLSQNQ